MKRRRLNAPRKWWYWRPSVDEATFGFGQRAGAPSIGVNINGTWADGYVLGYVFVHNREGARVGPEKIPCVRQFL